MFLLVKFNFYTKKNSSMLLYVFISLIQFFIQFLY